MAIPPIDIRILFTDYDIIAYFFKPGFLFDTSTGLADLRVSDEVIRETIRVLLI
jgi:hypothetical protein